MQQLYVYTQTYLMYYTELWMWLSFVHSLLYSPAVFLGQLVSTLQTIPSKTCQVSYQQSSVSLSNQHHSLPPRGTHTQVLPSCQAACKIVRNPLHIKRLVSIVYMLIYSNYTDCFPPAPHSSRQDMMKYMQQQQMPWVGLSFEGKLAQDLQKFFK